MIKHEVLRKTMTDVVAELLAVIRQEKSFAKPEHAFEYQDGYVDGVLDLRNEVIKRLEHTEDAHVGSGI